MAYSHGMSRTPEYRAWSHMKERCFNPNTKQYLDYGGRGINVCHRWLWFENFLADMGMKPSPKHSIDRIDNDGNYQADNCKWSTPKEQVDNQRIRKNSKSITIGCVTLTIYQWGKEMGFNREVIRKRLKMGWSERDAVLTPIKQYEASRLITIGCVSLTISEWTKKMSFGKNVISNRLASGWSELKAVTTPINTAYQRYR